MTKNVPESRDTREVYYSEKLLGLQQHCDMHHCRNMEHSTGWLCYQAGVGDHHWFLGFECPTCGRGVTSSKNLQPLIDEVLQDAKREGFDIDSAVQKLREKYDQKMVEIKEIMKKRKKD